MKRFFKRIIEWIFRPTRLDYAKPFGWGWKVIIIGFFLLVFILAIPPVASVIVSSVISPRAKASLVSNKEIIKTWLGFISFVLELLLVILLGQILFTEPTAQRLKRIVAYAQIKNQLALDIELFAKQENLKNAVDEIYALLRGDEGEIKGKLRRAERISVLFRELVSSLYPGMRGYYTKVLLLSLATSFPGGFYGLVAFVLFAILSLAKLSSIYMDLIVLEVTQLG